MDEFNKKVIKIGTITVMCAIIANFIPVLYLWLVHGQIPTGDQLVQIFGMVFAASAVSWIVQPLSYYGALGNVGTYIAWIAGSAADIRVPSVTMAQKVTDTEANTPDGDAIGAMALAASVFTTVTIITVFTLIGYKVIPLLPKAITDSFVYMQPALFAAVFVNMAIKNLRAGLPTLIIGLAAYYLLGLTGISKAWLTLIIVAVGMVIAATDVKRQEHKQNQ